jgi:hypothetical protein
MRHSFVLIWLYSFMFIEEISVYCSMYWVLILNFSSMHESWYSSSVHFTCRLECNCMCTSYMTAKYLSEWTFEERETDIPRKSWMFFLTYLILCHARIVTLCKHYLRLIIGLCILLRVILTVNNNTFCFATIDKVFYCVASVLTRPNIRAKTCREYRSYIIKYFVNCCETEDIIIYNYLRCLEWL